VPKLLEIPIAELIRPYANGIVRRKHEGHELWWHEEKEKAKKNNECKKNEKN
jgi:hypothetical protein